MEEEEVGQTVPENAGTGVDFNAMMRRMARESIAGSGPSTNIDVETLRATAATLAQKAMAILSDESAKGRPIGGVNDIAAAMARRLYQSAATEETQVEPSAKLKWNAVDGAKGYIIYWRDTTSPTWDYSRYVGNVTEFTLNGIVIDNYNFGVAAIGENNFESLVTFPNRIIRN